MAEQVNRSVAKKGTADLENALNEFNESHPVISKRGKSTASRKASAPRAKKASRQKKVVIVARGKRKEAIARASMSSGSGLIRINGVSAGLIKPKEVRDLILEPIIISKKVGGIMKNYDVNINVYGGGIMGQAQAARTAIAKAIVETTKNEGLKRAYMLYDRSLLVEDHRRVEPKKAGGPKARARNQTSYR